ncbi:hypothetical protein [Natranaeroarchaeum aerophilus]|uniref:Uncharacterized protein n=1 Tax=Natranaeroarchaeum aerophilus TaxID=2917711 RepID=A0AAE3FNL4_9EURY|nr:hypothetical protein [Natranaeroarchaeum aerophilus]MCL9812281.1 hypothetical protein [Natranaeroarchaeum aerophilus]
MADRAHSGKSLESDDTGRLWQRLAGRRYVAWAVFFFGSLLLAPDPTGLLPIVTALGLIVLFEGVVRVLRWRGR